MYVACVPLKVAGSQVQPGETVPGAEKWQECVIRAHLNLGWMEKRDETPSAQPKELVEEAASKDGTASVNSKKNPSKKKTAKKPQGKSSEPVAV